MIKAGSRLLGVGTDIVYLPRFTKLLQRYPLQGSIEKKHSFIRIARKFMHPTEIIQMNSLQATSKRSSMATDSVITYVAGIWAIKESIFKAFSSFVPSCEMPPAQSIYTKLVYKQNSSGKLPHVRFDDQFSIKASPFDFEFYKRYIGAPSTEALVSISHDGDYLVAFTCLVEGKQARRV